MKFMKNTQFKKIILLSFLLFLYVLISAKYYVDAVTSDLSEALFRLHVIANSDNIEDQSLKLKVRDSLLTYMNTICSNCLTKEDALLIVRQQKSEFQKIAEQTILENGYNYSVNINIGNFYFPTKNYGDITLPSSSYDALRVEIGKAKGQNWWCVMFPSLCFIDISSGVVDENAKENLEKSLQNESYSIISETQKPNIKFKFKLIEFFAENDLFKIANTNVF